MRKKLAAILLIMTMVFAIGSAVYAEGMRFPILPSPECGPMAIDVETTEV